MTINLATVSLGSVLKRVGTFTMDSFEDRLVLQKRIYLLQVFGIYLGYKFAWYIHGPYSPNLTRDGFKLVAISNLIPKVKFAKKNIEKKFNNYLSFLGNRHNDGDWLEQLSCTHFLKALYPEAQRDEIIQMVLDHEYHFTRKQCEEAYDYLVEHDLISLVN